MPTPTRAAVPDRVPVTGCARASKRQMFWSVTFGVSLGVGIAVLRHLHLPTTVQFAVPLVPLLAGYLYVRALLQDIQRQMDELQLRIYLEAAAVAVTGLFIVMMVYPLFEAAHLVGPLEYHTVLVILVALGLVGYIAARRRYR